MGLSRFLPRRRRRPPAWRTDLTGIRVLLEHPDADVLGQRLAEHGYRVLPCSGPAPDGRGPSCPLHDGKRCPGLDGADAVVVALDLETADHRAHADLVRAAAPGLPVVVDPRLSRMRAIDQMASPHRTYRTTIAPLVRRLHELLHGPRA